jgi:hypothetical protein
MTTLGVFRDDFYNATAVLPQSQFSATTQATGTVLSAALLAGATENYIAFSGQVAVSVATDSAANIIAALQTALAREQAALGLVAANTGQPAGVPNLNTVGFFVQLINNNTGTLTLTAGAGVTINGTATAATLTSRQFIVTVTGPNSVTFQNVGSGSN